MAYGDRKYQQSPQAKEIHSLRKEGKLKEAYGCARSYYSGGLREESFMSAYTWVFYDCLKRYYDEKNSFYNDIRAYCSVLAQIRKFPLNSERDELFIEKLQSHVRGVGWKLREQRRIADIRILSMEICQWRQGSPLHNSDIARMLLVATKPSDADTVPVLQWLGFSGASWLAIVSGQYQIQHCNDVTTNAFAWALYDDLKQFVGNDHGRRTDIMRFLQILSTMRSALLSSCARHEAVTYAVGQLVHIGWECRKHKDFSGVERLLAEATQWPRTSSMHFQEVLTMFSVALKERPAGIIDLVNWYGLDSLSSEDFIPRVYEGKQQASRAQELVKAYLDALLANDATGSPVATAEQKEHGCDTVSALLKDRRCADWIWEPYKLGKLLTTVGRIDEARVLLAPIVAMKQSEPWSWFAYGATWQAASPENYEKCLFMGLRCSNNPQFSKSLHEAAAMHFADNGQFGRAKAEALVLRKLATDNGWKESPIVATLESERWFSETEASVDNASLYDDLSEGAEDIVAQDLPWSEFYVDKAIPDTGHVHIVSEAPSKEGYIRTTLKNKKIASFVHNGSCYRGHFDVEHRSLLGEIELYPDAKIASQFISSYSGQIDLVKNFGFVNSRNLRVFVSPALLEGKGAKLFQQASGNCRKTFKVSKESPSSGHWAWEATSLELGEEANPSTYRKEGNGIFRFASSRYLGRRSFGFVSGLSYEDLYVSATLIEKHQLSDHQRIGYVAEKSWDSKKSRWGWKVVEITSTGETSTHFDDDDDNWDHYEAEYEPDYAAINEKYEKIVASQEASTDIDAWDDVASEWSTKDISASA